VRQPVHEGTEPDALHQPAADEGASFGFGNSLFRSVHDRKRLAGALE
jgi:hypothetical protein